jgi:iron complex outermembrane receptor protein
VGPEHAVWQQLSALRRGEQQQRVDGHGEPRSFDAGGLAFAQWTTNLDFFRDLSLGEGRPLRTAVGAEFRLDRFEITAGDSASWMDGRQPILDGPNAGSATARPAPGAQGFPGFRPADEQNVDRNNYAVYVDLESDISPKLILGAAGRFEDYNDFGSTATGKVTARYAIRPELAVRGAFNTGFRAPSLGQSFFSSTATNLVAGQFLEIRTFPVGTPGRTSARCDRPQAREIDERQRRRDVRSVDSILGERRLLRHQDP